MHDVFLPAKVIEICRTFAAVQRPPSLSTTLKSAGRFIETKKSGAIRFFCLTSPRKPNRTQ
jgi:hypothetical protein